jgi:flagellar L-ring protein FlgH
MKMIERTHTAVLSSRFSTLPILVLAGSLFMLSACASKLDKLEQVGQTPPMSRVYDPTAQQSYQPITWPMPVAEADEPKHAANSLWRQGSNTFFRDQRASRVGDILKIVMDLKDRGRLESTTERTRTGSEQAGLGALFGFEGHIPGQGGVNGLLQSNSASISNGDGQIERREELQTEFAATVTQVLPNGNLVIDGRQEIRMNDEIREIVVQGVIRPQDIASNNTIDYSQIAEARIGYGGRGMIADAQRPRWGQQVIDVLSPF